MDIGHDTAIGRDRTLDAGGQPAPSRPDPAPQPVDDPMPEPAPREEPPRDEPGSTPDPPPMIA